MGPFRTSLRQLRKYGPKLGVVAAIEEMRGTYYDYLRNKYCERRIQETAAAVGPGLWVGGPSRVNAKTELGENVHFMGMEIRGDGPVTIGDNFHSGSGCDVITANHNYDDGDAIPYDDTYVEKAVSIGDNVWFGIDVTVVPGVTIGEGAIVQPGSVVTSDVPSGAIAGGHPAAVFDHRDMDHYKRLKAEGKFR